MGLFLLLIGSTHALSPISSRQAELLSSPPSSEAIVFTIQETDTLESGYPLDPDDRRSPEGLPRPEGDPSPEGYPSPEGGRSPEGDLPPEGRAAPDVSSDAPPDVSSDAPDAQDDCLLKAEFVGEGSRVKERTVEPDEPFFEIWRVRNSGTCVWDESYSVKEVSNNTFELLQQKKGLAPTAPGDEVEITLSLVAPIEIGSYLAAWQLQTPKEELFGPVLSMQLVVSEDAVPEERVLTDTDAITATAQPNNTPTIVPTATPTEVPTATPTETPTEVPTATPTEVPTATPSPSATTTPIEVPTNTPIAAPTSTPVAPVVTEGGQTAFLSSLPGPLSNPLVLTLVILIPILFAVLLLLLWRLSRSSQPPSGPTPTTFEPPSDDQPPSNRSAVRRGHQAPRGHQAENASISFEPQAKASQPVEQPFDEASIYPPPSRAPSFGPSPVARQSVEPPRVPARPPQPSSSPSASARSGSLSFDSSFDSPSRSASPFERGAVEPPSYAPWDDSPSSFAPRPTRVKPVRRRSTTKPAFSPSAARPPVTEASSFTTEPIRARWSNEPIDSTAFPMKPPAVGTPYLQSLTRPAGTIYFPLTKGVITVGRDKENDLIIDESFIGWQTVSRRHAQIERDGADIVLVDLGATNGVQINGQQTGSNLLQHDCTISVGQIQFAFCINKQAPQ